MPASGEIGSPLEEILQMHVMLEAICCSIHRMISAPKTLHHSGLLVVQATVRGETCTCGPLGVVAAKESHQRRNIIDLTDPRSGGCGVDQRLHVFEELLVTLEPLIWDSIVSLRLRIRNGGESAHR